MKSKYAAFLGVVLAVFALDNVNGLVRSSGLGGSLAQAQSFAEPADESSSNADVAAEPETKTNIAGTWNGPLTDTAFGDGTITLTIKQKNDAASVKGTWTIIFATETISGTLRGSVNNGTGTLKLKRKSHHHGTCIVKAAITVPDATHMNATFMTTGGCNPSSTGTFMVTD